jgi:hypothetical protein
LTLGSESIRGDQLISIYSLRMTNAGDMESSAATQEATLEELFDRFFEQSPESHQRIEKGRLQDLSAFELQHFKDFYPPNILSDTRRLLNERLHLLGERIQPPHGPATLRLDFVDSSSSNRMTFSLEGKYFIGITSRMLLDFDRASVALTGRGAVRNLLIVPDEPRAIWALISAFLALQIQFIKEYKLTAAMENLLLHYPNQDAEQAKEWLADRYAVRMLLQNLISTTTGFNMQSQIKSSLPQEEYVLWLLLCVASATEAVARQSDRRAEVSIGHIRPCRRQG